MDRFDETAALRNWQPPAELAGSIPRQVRLKAAGIFLRILAALFFVGVPASITGLGSIARTQNQQHRLLQEQGKDVDGLVTRLWRTGGKDDQHMVAYQFESEGQTYAGRASAPSSAWRSLEVGMPIRVRYVPSSPRLNHPTDWSDTPLPTWAPFLVAAIVAGVGALFLFLVRRQVNLLSDGRAAPGKILRYSWASHGQRYVHYEFPLMSGAPAKGRSGPTRKLPPIGSVICVIYDRDNPRRNARYPMPYVKLT